MPASPRASQGDQRALEILDRRVDGSDPRVKCDPIAVGLLLGNFIASVCYGDRGEFRDRRTSDVPEGQ